MQGLLRSAKGRREGSGRLTIREGRPRGPWAAQLSGNAGGGGVGRPSSGQSAVCYNQGRVADQARGSGVAYRNAPAWRSGAGALAQRDRTPRWPRRRPRAADRAKSRKPAIARRARPRLDSASAQNRALAPETAAWEGRRALLGRRLARASAWTAQLSRRAPARGDRRRDRHAAVDPEGCGCRSGSVQLGAP